MPLRLAVWNCNMRLHDKLEGLRLLAPDVIVIPECACPEVLLRRAPRLGASAMLWTGRTPSKGLAVLSFGRWRVTTDPAHDPRGGTTIAARIHGPVELRLAAAWARPRAAEPLHRALIRLRGFLAHPSTAIAGDFNDTLVRHPPLTRALDALGFASAYHRSGGLGPGGEGEPTLYLRRREGLRGHRDLVLLGPRLQGALRGVAVGSRSVWTGASDHAPVVAEIDTDPLVP